MDLAAVRTFVAAADTGQFQTAADDLALTQQAVSKRIAALERELDVRLFTRGARGVQLTADGEAFLAPARELLLAGERAEAAVRPGRRPLRVDVISSRSAPAGLLREFHRARPQVSLEVVTHVRDARAAIAALASGAIDASFRAVPALPGQLPGGIAATRVLDEPLELFTGPRHALAGTRAVTPAELAGHRIWMPGILAGSEWAAFYAQLAAAFGLTIDTAGPNFGSDAMLEEIAGSPDLATFFSERLWAVRPARSGLRRIAIRDPVLAYPHSLIWRRDNPHPALAALRGYLGTTAPRRAARTWTGS